MWQQLYTVGVPLNIIALLEDYLIVCMHAEGFSSSWEVWLPLNNTDMIRTGKSKTRSGHQKPVKHSTCQKFKKQPAIKYAFWSEWSSLWSISPIWLAKYFYLPTVSSSERVRSSCLDSRCTQRSQELLLCLHVVQHKAARSHCFQVWKREIGENLQKYCYCLNLLHQSAWKGWFQG